MKLSKDQIQKIVLTALMLCAFLYFFFTSLLGGLSKQEEKAQKRIHELEPQLLEAKKQINECNRLEADAPKAADRIAELKGLIPDGSPLAWFPPKIGDFFKRQNITISTPHLQRDQTDFGVPGLARMTWVVEVPKVDAISLGIAIAGLENEDPLTRIDALQISALPENPELQRASLTLCTIVKK